LSSTKKWRRPTNTREPLGSSDLVSATAPVVAELLAREKDCRGGRIARLPAGSARQVNVVARPKHKRLISCRRDAPPFSDIREAPCAFVKQPFAKVVTKAGYVKAAWSRHQACICLGKPVPDTAPVTMSDLSDHLALLLPRRDDARMTDPRQSPHRAAACRIWGTRPS
jgi:hypothetical protein